MQQRNIEDYIKKRLVKMGWPEEDILFGTNLVQNERILRPDMILLYNLYPLAILEAKQQSKFLKDAGQQGLLYAEALPEIPFVIASTGRKSIITKTIDGKVSEISGLPTPKELWSSLNREWNEPDPRIFPLIRNSNIPIRLHQARAVSKTIDSIIGGKKRNLVVMIQGSGRTISITQLLWKLIRSGYIKKTLFLTDRWGLANQAQSVLQDAFQQDVRTFQHLGELGDFGAIDITVIHTFFDRQGTLKPLQRAKDFYDLIVADDLKRTDLMKSLLEYFDDTFVVGFTRSLPHVKNITEVFEPPIFTYDLTDALNTEQFDPPPGFVAKALGDIAEIDAGMVRRKNEEDDNKNFDLTPKDYPYLVSARDINENGHLDLKSAHRLPQSSLQASKVFNRHDLQPDDIVVNSYFLGRNRIKIGYVTNSIREKALVSSSLIRVRINEKYANPKDVYQFLISDIGQRALQMYAQGSTSPRLTERYLLQVPIFLPISDAFNLTNKKSFSASSMAINELENKVLPLLKDIVDQSDIENDQKLREAQQRLSEISASLLPPPLSERIVHEYPIPIAFAYQQFMNAKFNIYEQVQRLKDTFEAANFFVFNLLFADFLRNLDPRKYYIENPQARRAYKGYSMAHRIGFIETVQELARSNKGQDLFVPEIINYDTEKAKLLQNDLRNKAAHTATASEHAQRKVLERFEPMVGEILVDLEFLTNYRLVRIPLFYFNRGRFIRRVEFYQGVAPYVEDTPIEVKNLIPAEQEHLVLVDDEENILDLYPFYQLIASERSNYQKHVAFLKQRKFQERKLEGESVQGAYNVDMEGFEEFENLATKILERRPEK